jgi:hypothetical protein
MNSSVWDIARMSRVVQDWDRALREALPAYARLVPEAEGRGSVLRQGATESQITAAEQRLGRRLPPSYRAFLAISDGADAGVFGADRVERWYGENRNALLGAEAVRPSNKGVDWLVRMWLENFRDFADRQELPSEGMPTQVMDFEPGLQAVALNEPQQDATLALVPFEGEWQVWWFVHEEVTAYLSFAEFLLDRTRRAGELVAEREARLREAPGDGVALVLYARALAETGDSRAVETACQAIAEGYDSAIVELVKLGDPRAIPTLREVYADADTSSRRTQLSSSQRRTMAVWGLQSCGDPWIVEELRGLVEAEPENEWAAKLLAMQDEIVRW